MQQPGQSELSELRWEVDNEYIYSTEKKYTVRDNWNSQIEMESQQHRREEKFSSSIFIKTKVELYRRTFFN